MFYNPSLEAYAKEQNSNRPPAQLVYLAAPFTAEDPLVQQTRRDAVIEVSDHLVRQGKAIFSPLEYTKGMQDRNVFPPQGWYEFDLAMLRNCQELLVLTLPGWQTSYGVIIEMTAARALGIPIKFIEPDDVYLSPRVHHILLSSAPEKTGQ